ncbi:hypothetical protein ACFP6B_01950 [Rothia nasimurium]|uniref:hypothetical protein n=1 Tax=Rothia nasimurium TaxID=85336 RepID=UPI003613CA1C
MNEPNRHAKIPKVHTDNDQLLEGSVIPSKEENPSFFTQKFYCAGKDPQGTPCRAAAAAKTKYTRTNKNGTLSTVSGNFHLAPDAAHIEQCSYDIMAQIHQLHTTYQDTIEKVENHYLLTIPRKMNNDAPEATRQEGRAADDIQTLHTTKDTGHREPTLQQVTQTAAAILELFERFDEEDEAKKHFRIKYAGKTYRWEQFFYSAATDAAKLYQAASEDPKRPMVLYGKVGDTPKKNKAKRYSIWVLNSARAKVPREDKIISLSIYTDDPVAANLAKGQLILAIGYWKPKGKYLGVSATAQTYITY